jgi:sec-independent protein translocase protein TatA
VIGDILQPTHLLFILVIALIVLGPKRLPEVGRSLGKGLRDFRTAMSGEGEHAEIHDSFQQAREGLSQAHQTLRQPIDLGGEQQPAAVATAVAAPPEEATYGADGEIAAPAAPVAPVAPAEAPTAVATAPAPAQPHEADAPAEEPADHSA